MRSLQILPALRWAVGAWYKHKVAWITLWFIFLACVLFYVFAALIIGLLNPLVAIFVYGIGCLLPSYVYGAFIEAGLQQYEHPLQIIEKHFLSYFSIGTAIDILVARLLFISMVIGLVFLAAPLRWLMAQVISPTAASYSLGIMCVYLTFGLLYFYPYVVVDTHKKTVITTTFAYAYYDRWYCFSMTTVWILAVVVTVATGGIAGFFLFPVLTLADVYRYQQLKR